MKPLYEYKVVNAKLSNSKYVSILGTHKQTDTFMDEKGGKGRGSKWKGGTKLENKLSKQVQIEYSLRS